ncbi:EAL domain-containing protein [Pseudomonas benzenivorans]|uniref:EAL domain-containing protein n=1 Tax=Pseudomonas benzenivorans TaxID=556533 RepID=A0ABY5H8B3_9PSED|nr:EAL domain-containing protein [Pseudomonas benzenivorans]UTW07520.1 EAL domain-containing protein [Pseudomonas benzenivorans]
MPASALPVRTNADTQAIARILLIDDNRSNLELMREILIGEDRSAAHNLESLEAALFGDKPAARAPLPRFTVEHCEDGREGRDLLASALAAGRPYAVAFVDMRMPGGWDGLQTIEALWQVDADLQVVICSAYDDHSWEQIVDRLGCLDNLLFLRKPFDPIEVLQLATALSEKWRLQRARQNQLAELHQHVAERTRHLQQALDQRLRVERELLHLSTHDALTGLANRPLFMDRLEQAMILAQRQERQLLIAFIDLDRFKQFNDRLGRQLGDQLLQMVAQRMSACLRESDTLARLGGDEFALLLPDTKHAKDAMSALTRLLGRLAEPFSLAGEELSLTCSLGCSIYPDDGADGEDLLRYATAAAYRAKELGRNTIQAYNPELHARLQERQLLESALHRALENNEFELYYQPQIDLRSGRLSGLEALLRWHHPQLGDISPARFIPIAEDNGLIHQIGEWTLYSACRQLLAWQQQGIALPRVALNLSAKQAAQPGLDALISRCLKDTGIDPCYLELELTETASMDDPEHIIPLMQRLRKLGINLAIDDFGTGYSNLSYLQLFPVGKLKLDGSFVRGITSDAGSMAIIDAVIALAHRLGLKVVAEMAETEAQVIQLAAHGCDQVQGYYFSPPLPAAKLEPLLRAGAAALPTPAGDDGAKRVLILDDEQHVTSAIRRAFRHEHFEVLTANNAAQAFDLLARHRVGVVLSDQRMPDMNGNRFLNQVRMLYPETVRILFTGYTDFQSIREAINLGAAHQLIDKPWNNGELQQLISQGLEQYAQNRQQQNGANG